MTSNSTLSNGAKRPEKLAIRSTASRDSKSVYDRLYKAGTASSKARKGVVSDASKDTLMREHEEPVGKSTSRKVPPQNYRPKKVTGTSTNGEVFSRLYQNGTASSVSKRSHTDAVSRAPMRPKNHF